MDRDPTPLRASARSSVQLANNSITDAALKVFLRDVFTAQIHRRYPVVSFVKKVFSFSPSNLPAKQYSLPVEACRKYAVSTGERNCYEPLKQIFDSLRSQVCEVDDARPLLAHFVDMYDRQPDSSTGAKLKPDFYFSTQPGRDKQHWTSCLGYGEVKRRRKVVKFYGNGKIDMSRFASVCSHIITFHNTILIIGPIFNRSLRSTLRSLGLNQRGQRPRNVRHLSCLQALRSS